MTNAQPGASRQLPGFFKKAISVAIVFHLLALSTMVMSAPTGPWSVRYLNQPSPSERPSFASSIAQYTTPAYLQPLGLANNYHFDSCLTDVPTIYLNVLPHMRGEPEKYPDAQANMWVRHRQRLLVNRTGGDFPFQPRGAQGIPGPNQEIEDVAFFCHPFDAVKFKLMGKKKEYRSKELFLAEVASALNRDEFDRYKDQLVNIVKGPQPEESATYELTDKAIDSLQNLDPSERPTFLLYHAKELLVPKVPPMAPPIMRPSSSSTILVRSFAAYLKQRRGEEVEVVREFRQPISPMFMFPDREGKLLIETQTLYSLDSFYHSFGNGEPRNWTGK